MCWNCNVSTSANELTLLKCNTSNTRHITIPLKSLAPCLFVYLYVGGWGVSPTGKSFRVVRVWLHFCVLLLADRDESHSLRMNREATLWVQVSFNPVWLTPALWRGCIMGETSWALGSIAQTSHGSYIRINYSCLLGLSSCSVSLIYTPSSISTYPLGVGYVDRGESVNKSLGTLIETYIDKGFY